MFIIDEIREDVKVYNDGILILEATDIMDLKELIYELIRENEDIWEVEILEKILYTINNNLSTTEVA